METIHAQRSKKLEETKTPEVRLCYRRLRRKRPGDSCVPFPYCWPKVKYRRPVRQIEFVAELVSAKSIRAKDFTALFCDCKFFIVRANGQGHIWFESVP